MNSIVFSIQIFVIDALVGKVMFVRGITGPLMVSSNNILEERLATEL